MNNLMWIVTAASISGTILNIKRKPVCFFIWLVTNSLWLIYDVSIGAYAQAAMMAVYVGLSLWGIVEWRKKR
jgi:nicotinamide riboside transporter PnuC